MGLHRGSLISLTRAQELGVVSSELSLTPAPQLGSKGAGPFDPM